MAKHLYFLFISWLLLMPILSIYLFFCICNSLFNPFLQKLPLSWLGSDFLAETGKTSDCLASGETQWPIVQCWFWTLERTQHLCPGNCSQELCMWDRPRTWDSLLQCLHLDTALLKLQNTKKLFGVKNNNIRGQWGQIPNKRHKETKRPNCQFWRAWSKSRVMCLPFAHNPTWRWSDYLGHPSGTLSPGKEPVCLVFAPSCGSRGPSKALPEFLVWSLINFYWWRR